MNHISKTHKLFSERLRNPRVLTNPEEFLGPNYKTVLNFWLIIDDLSAFYILENNYREINALSVSFRKLENYESLREELFNTSPISSRIKVILLNMTYGVFGYFKIINDYSALATLELIIDHSKPSIIQHFINEPKHS